MCFMLHIKQAPHRTPPIFHQFQCPNQSWCHPILSSRILGGLRPFIAWGLGATFWVVPFMVWRLDVGMTIYICEGSDVPGVVGGGRLVWYYEVDNRSRCDRHQVGGHKWKHTKSPNSGQGDHRNRKRLERALSVIHKQLRDEMCDMLTTKDAYVW